MNINTILQELEDVKKRAADAATNKEYLEASRLFKQAGIILHKVASQVFDENKQMFIDEGNKQLYYAKTFNDIAKGVTVQSGGGKQTAADEGLTEFKAAKIPEISFVDIAGLDHVKNEIRRKLIYPMRNKDVADKLNLKNSGGMILYGPPGTGKTMIAKAIAHEIDAVFFAVKGSDIVSKYLGESSRNIKQLFNTARQHKTSIIFFDELDSLFRTRGEDKHNDERVNELLQQMEGFDENKNNMFFLGATNCPWDVDPAAKRPGRFTMQVLVPLPDDKAREYLLRRSLGKIKLPCEAVFEELVARTAGYSGADIEEIISNAARNALERIATKNGEQKLLQSDLDISLQRAKKSVTEAMIMKYELYEKSIL